MVALYYTGKLFINPAKKSWTHLGLCVIIADMGHRRPEITEERIGQIKMLIADNPDWNRSRLSKELCELWDWKSETGQAKDISCRDMLRALEAAGRIELPPRQTLGRKTGEIRHIQLRIHDTTLLETELRDITPVSIEIAQTKSEIDEFKSYIEQYHYLGYGRSVGECMRYVVRAKSGGVLALLLFGSSAWRCAPRDKFIGWNDEERLANLHLTTNNTRFLIPEWVKAPCLASHVLSLISRRISSDWQDKYGHPIVSLETFVERERFRGTCYQAANWRRVGETTGRGRDSLTNRATLPIKDVYVYPLSRRFRKILTSAV